MADQISPRKRLQNRQNQAAHRARQKQHINSLETRLGEVQSAYIVAMESIQLAGRRVSEENEFLRKIIKEQLGITDLNTLAGAPSPTSPTSPGFDHSTNVAPVSSRQPASPLVPLHPAVAGSPTSLNLALSTTTLDGGVTLDSQRSSISAPTWNPVTYDAPSYTESGLEVTAVSPLMQPEVDFEALNETIIHDLFQSSSLPESSNLTLSPSSGASSPYTSPPNPAPSPIQDLQIEPVTSDVNTKLAAAFSLLSNACGSCHSTNTYGQLGYSTTSQNTQPTGDTRTDRYSWYLGEASPSLH